MTYEVEEMIKGQLLIGPQNIHEVAATIKRHGYSHSTVVNSMLKLIHDGRVQRIRDTVLLPGWTPSMFYNRSR